MSKKIKIFVFVLSAYLIFSLLYTYKTNISVAEQIEINEGLRSKITEIEEFKADIANMSLMSRYYILTGDNKYKVNFEKNYFSALSNLNDLQKAEYITEEDKKLIEQNLNQYNYLTCKDLQNTNIKDVISSNYKDSLHKLTDIEYSLIDNTAYTLLSSIEKASSNSKASKNLLDTQNNLLQIIGGFISMILLSPLYFLKKNPTFISDAFKNFISSHIKKNSSKIDEKLSSKKSENNSLNCNEEMIQCINNGLINNLETLISERDQMISTLKIVYSHNEYMQKEWTKAKASLDSIEQDLLELKKELNILMSKSDIPYEKINLLENKFLEIRFLLEKLPQYNEFIMNLLEKN